MKSVIMVGLMLAFTSFVNAQSTVVRDGDFRGNANLNEFGLANVGKIGFVRTTAVIPTNFIVASPANTFMTLDISTTNRVEQFTGLTTGEFYILTASSGSVLFVHNTAKITVAAGSNLTLATTNYALGVAFSPTNMFIFNP